MVMASAPGRRPSAASSPREASRTRRGGAATGAGDAAAARDRLVAYAHALDSAHEARSGVWVEHSYARAGLGGETAPGAVRVLLAHREPPDLGDRVDVEREDPPPPDPPLDSDDSSGAGSADEDAAAEDEADDWEARLAGLAPGAEHARLAREAGTALRRVRLARLAGGRAAAAFARREQARALRRVLAPLWLAAPAGGARPPQWLHAALPAYAPRAVRRDYERLVAELRRAAPHLAERLAGARPPAPLPPPALADGPVKGTVGADEGPWLVWVGPGRWARLLGALVHTRRVAAATSGAATPDAWCAAVAGAARVAIADILAEAGSRPVVIGGCGGWATLGWSAAGGAARGLLALGPARLTGEGEARPPPGAALLVAGGAAAAGGGALAETLGARQRLLLLAGADAALRLPARLQRRLRLPQRALDALVADECARWVHELCDAAEPDPPPPRAAESEEEYAHLPAPVVAPPPQPSGSDHRSIEIVEGRVVSRGSGGTPLALLPPRREPRAERRAEREPRAEHRRALAAADIMQLPIVFADDESTVEAQPEPRAGAVTVRSGGPGGGGPGEGEAGGFKYARVIVAKRGAGGGRPLLLRRGVRLVPRDR